ncbi:hypothetical protein CYLTODRAFT_419268 [Cylindrobasidium torrendii FP15055 ss-10]|uniref:Uncharacterized protein n=1 Tax=Cylindrobasidium torrendii FP15055 ss-10 TaxID=1314674 RepID=A0A0D7BLI1_9AGAR|nr:hypothetical protein CYLTODRAFT_419268 [Cylindrobasidium torrendii FP15055 ss-10]
MSRVYAAFKDFPSLPLLYTHHSYDEWHFSEQYFGRVKFSRQVRVRPVDQMLPPGAPPLGSTYERLRHDATRNTNWHLRRNGRRTRDHKLPPAAIPLRQIPPIVDPSPRVRPSEPRDPTSHVRTSNRHQQKPYGEPRQQSRVHPKQENFPRHSQPTAQRPVAHPHTSTRPSAKPEPQKLKKPTRQSEASRSQWNLPQENHKPPRTTRGCPYEFFARTLRRTFRSTSSASHSVQVLAESLDSSF